MNFEQPAANNENLKEKPRRNSRDSRALSSFLMMVAGTVGTWIGQKTSEHFRETHSFPGSYLEKRMPELEDQFNVNRDGAIAIDKVLNEAEYEFKQVRLRNQNIAEKTPELAEEEKVLADKYHQQIEEIKLKFER